MTDSPNRADEILAAIRSRRAAERPVPAAVGEPDSDPLGLRIVEAVETILGRSGLRLSDCFGDVGGDSLLAVRVLSWCWQEFSIELPLRTLGTATTLRQLTNAVRSATDAEGGGGHIEKIETVPPDGSRYRLSPHQDTLYYIYEARPDLPTYNVPVTLRFSGLLDRGRLRWTLDQLVRRHEALRSSIRRGEDGLPWMTVRAPTPTPLEELDLTDLGNRDRDVLLDQAITEAVTSPLDLASSPLRFQLIRVRSDEHVLILLTHHIICDGWALNLLITDLVQLYTTGPDIIVPAPAIGALDVAVWERTRLGDDRAAALAAHWREVLTDAPEMLALPLDRPRPATYSYRGDRRPLKISARTVSSLRRWASENGITPFAVLATAFAVLLHRYTGQSDFVIGVPVANRHHPQTHDVATHMSNTIPLRIDLSDDPGLDMLAARLHEAVLTAQDHADLPFDRIVEAVAPQRSRSHHPLYQVALVLAGHAGKLETTAGLCITRTDLGTGTSKFDQSWFFEDHGDTMEGYVEFATDLFDHETIFQMQRHFQQLLESVVHTGSRIRASQITMLPKGEFEALVGQFIRPAVDSFSSVTDLFDHQVEQRPNLSAVWHDGRDVCYKQLANMADQLAERLRGSGVGPETIVATCIPRSVHQVAAVLAILRTGGAYLPLDPTYPTERLKYMVNDSGADVVITTAENRKRISATRAATLTVDERREEPATRYPYPEINPDGLAYVIFTSGSTGRPKGVELHHRGLSNVIVNSRRDFGIGPGTRVMQLVSLSFDASVWDIFMALASGGTLCLGPPSPAESAPTLEEIVRKAEPDLIFLPPAMLSIIDPAVVPSVRLAITGGDRIPPELRDRWLAAGKRFVAAYGPTEGTIVQAWAERPHGDKGQPPIGQPFHGVSLYILDSTLTPVPYGAVGEVYIGGPAVARCYRNRAALTAERFLPDPFAEAPGERMYRTGDLVRRRRNGELEFVSRLDRQVKIRGLRIELGEVEAAIAAQPGVGQATAMVRMTSAGQPSLVGYVVAADSTSEGGLGERLRQKLLDQLPIHLVPTHIYVVPAFPLTANGKVDRTALAAISRLDAEELDTILDRLEGMPDVEVEALLAKDESCAVPERDQGISG